jgi:hypothetical protein
MTGTRRVPGGLRQHFGIVHCAVLFVPNNIARPRLFVAEESGKEPVCLIKA